MLFEVWDVRRGETYSTKQFLQVVQQGSCFKFQIWNWRSERSIFWMSNKTLEKMPQVSSLSESLIIDTGDVWMYA